MDTPTLDADPSMLMTTYVVEYEDLDGYTIRETCQLSPIFTNDDREAMYALWGALGEDAGYFPEKDAFYNESHILRRARDTFSCDKLEYILGTYMVENLTEGFSITASNPRTYYGKLCAERIVDEDKNPADPDAYDLFNRASVVAGVRYSGINYFGDDYDIALLGRPQMTSDTWGPHCFILALPNGVTPNRPNGFRYDKLEVKFGEYNGAWTETFKLSYYV